MNKTVRGMDKKLAAWVITMGKSCSQPCFSRSFEYCILPWTWHPETLSYQCVISRNSTVFTNFTMKQQHWNAKCDCSQCKIRWTHSHGFEKQALRCSPRPVFKQPFYLTLHWAYACVLLHRPVWYSMLNWVHPI